jgi:serine/threonine protein kinase/tetratricopeptide (TPR) repeat protein
MQAEMPRQRIGSRYQLLEVIGYGGMGTVYRAYDHLHRQQVALKRVSLAALQTSNPQNANELNVALAREFQMLASLRHPNIISVLDYGFDSDGHPFFTMELLDRPRTLLLTAQNQPLMNKIHLLIQVLQALVYLHRRGVLHRDLKPTNALVTQDGQVKLLDFGLAILRSQADQDNFGGSTAYMAPELFLGKTPTEATDLFAIGVIAYEFFTGQHPFYNPDSRETLMHVLTRQPDMSLIERISLEFTASEQNTKPTTHANDSTEKDLTTRISSPIATNHDIEQSTLLSLEDTLTVPLNQNTFVVPRQPLMPNQTEQKTNSHRLHTATHPLVAITQKLLAKDFRERYNDAQQVIQDLCEAVQQPIPVETPATRESFLQAARFIGRQTEMAKLASALEAMQIGKGSLWFVSGESGIGKSRLFQEIRIQALVRGVMVLRGQAVATGVTYQMWRDPVRRLILNTDIDDANASILASVAPDIEEFIGRPVAPAPKLDPEEDQRRLTNAIATLFRQQTQPILVLLEDLHWAHSESLAVLRQLKQRVQQQALMIIGSYRDDELFDFVDTLDGHHVLKLSRFNDEEIFALGESMVGNAAHQPQVMNLLRHHSEGNAFFIVEIMRALAEEAGQLDLIGTINLPQKISAQGIEQIIQRRLRRVPVVHYPLLQVAAALGREIDLDLMEAATPSVNLTSWLYACSQAAVLEIQDEQWRFAHEKLRQGILGALSLEERSEVYQQAAVAIETVYPDNPEYAAVLVHLWNTVKNDAKVLHYAVLAGQHAYRTSNYSQAIHYFEQALHLLSQGNSRQETSQLTQLFTQLGKVYIQLGSYVEATTMLNGGLHLAVELEDSAALAEVLLSLGYIHFYQGNYSEASENLEHSLQLYRRLDERHGIADALRGLAIVADMLGFYDEAAARCRESLTISREMNDSLLIAKALNDLGVMALSQGDYLAAAQLLEEGLQLFQTVGSRVGIAETLLNLGQIAAFEGEYTKATNTLLESLAIYREIGNQHAIADALNNLGFSALMQNDYLEAQLLLQESLEILQNLDAQWSIANTLANLGHVETALENPSAATRYFMKALQQAYEIQAEPLLLEIIVGLAKLRVNAGDDHGALEMLIMVFNHPANISDIQAMIDPLIETLTIKLSPQTVEAALSQTNHDVNGFVSDLLNNEN